VGGGLQPPITRCPETGKPTTHSYLGESDQTSITGWNELPRLAWDRREDHRDGQPDAASGGQLSRNWTEV
jgi:hypothetical protein